jgi:TRAP-type C4-dicarboxylate transport system substrate-binding protein
MADLARSAQLNKLTFGFGLPYLYDSLAHLDRADAAGGLLAKVNEGVTPKGARVVALVAVGGGTGIFNTKREISKPDDMADLRMRGLDENQMKLFKSWGTNGVVITMPEVANALQTGIASGYINPPFVPFLFGHGAILKYYTPPMCRSRCAWPWCRKTGTRSCRPTARPRSMRRGQGGGGQPRPGSRPATPRPSSS